MPRNRQLPHDKNLRIFNAYDNVDINPEILKSYDLKLELDELYLNSKIDEHFNTPQLQKPSDLCDTYENNSQAQQLEKISDNDISPWSKFYELHKDGFFKDKKWLLREFPDLNGCKNKILEIGCGTGSSISVLNSDNMIYACDMSKIAIDLCSRRFSNSRKIDAINVNMTEESDSGIYLFIHDITCETTLPASQFDYIILVFTLSAIDPIYHIKVIKKVYLALKKGGKLFFKDYAIYDMVQMRYKPSQIIKNNYYKRNDGTFTYFFSLEEVRELMCDFSDSTVYEDRKMIINRKNKKEMLRVMIQGVFIK